MFKVLTCLTIFWQIIYGKYDCSYNDTIYLHTQEIAFFESTNFPKLVNNCSIKFQLNKTRGPIFVYAKYRFVVNYRYIPMYPQPVLSNDSFAMKINEDKMQAFNGMIIFEDWGDDACPLETISRINPFEFTDTTQILYISSSYWINRKRTHPCKWRFTAPSGYGFKIFVYGFDVSSTTQFTIRNTTHVIVNERSLELNFPYYNPDNHIQIYLSKDNSSFLSPMEFEAYVTIVKKEFNQTDKNCYFIKGKNLTWTNIGNESYSSHSRCNYELVIFPQTEVRVHVDTLQTESYVDHVKYYDEYGVNIIEQGMMVFDAYKNGSNRHILFEFTSDGSYESRGFLITFEVIACECADPLIILPCEGGNYNGIMNRIDDEYYCDNMKCNFTIKSSCPGTDAIFMDISTSGSMKNVFDKFRVISNGHLILEINEINRGGDNRVYLSATNENIFEVITLPSSELRSVIFYLIPTIRPSVDTKIILIPSNTTFILDVNTIKLATIEMSPELISQNISFKLYSNEPRYGMKIYQNESLALSVSGKERCFVSNSIYQEVCHISTSKLAIFESSFYSDTFLAFKLSGKSGGCVFNDNIFIETITSTDVIISALASPYQDCFITLLLDAPHIISKLWSTSQAENVKVFVGVKLTHLFFEFNSVTAFQWNDIVMNSKAYIIQIPQNTTILMKIRRNGCGTFVSDTETVELDCTSLTISKHPYQSIISSPDYGTTGRRACGNGLLVMSYNIKNLTAKFTALDYYFSNITIFYFETNTTKISVNKTGDSIAFTDQIVSLYYGCVLGNQSSKVQKYGILFHIETISSLLK